jgi:hypothetical protein
MKLNEAIVISAYTGVACCQFKYVHEYIEEVLGRPVLTHELASHSVWEEIKEKAKDDFLEICRGVES